MNKDNLYTSLCLLMFRLEDIKNNSMQDKSFVTALTEVLRYFKDNGELKEAFKYQKTLIQDIKDQPFYKSMLDMFCLKISTEHPDIPSLNIEKIMEKQFSDEFTEDKIKTILE